MSGILRAGGMKTEAGSGMNRIRRTRTAARGEWMFPARCMQAGCFCFFRMFPYYFSEKNMALSPINRRIGAVKQKCSQIEGSRYDWNMEISTLGRPFLHNGCSRSNSAHFHLKKRVQASCAALLRRIPMLICAKYSILFP